MLSRIMKNIEGSTFMLENGSLVVIEDFSQTLRTINGLIKYSYNTDTEQVVENDLTSQIEAINTHNIEGEQLNLGSEFLRYNFDIFKRALTLVSLLEAKIKESFNNIFMDDLSKSDNIDLVGSSNIHHHVGKGILQALDSELDGVILTKGLSISTNKVRISGQGMIPEYNWGMTISASNDGGSSWEDIVFENGNTLSDVHVFTSEPTGVFLLKLTLIPKAIYPEQPVTGKAYITSFAILY